MFRLKPPRDVLEMFQSENTDYFESFLLAFEHVYLQVLLRRARTNMSHRVEYKPPNNVSTDQRRI